MRLKSRHNVISKGNYSINILFNGYNPKHAILNEYNYCVYGRLVYGVIYTSATKVLSVD